MQECAVSSCAVQPCAEWCLLVQVYGFGAVSITMDAANNVIKANLGDRWVPVSLQQLVQEATRKRRV